MRLSLGKVKKLHRLVDGHAQDIRNGLAAVADPRGFRGCTVCLCTPRILRVRQEEVHLHSLEPSSFAFFASSACYVEAEPAGFVHVWLLQAAW